MKQAFEKSDAPQPTPAKSKSTTTKSSGANPNTAIDTTINPTRKRAPGVNGTAKKNAVKDNEKYKPDEDDDEHVKKKSKRAKRVGTVMTQHAIPRPSSKLKQPNPNMIDRLGHLPTPTLSNSINSTEATTLIKTEPNAYTSGPSSSIGINGDEEDRFYDANEYVGNEEEGVVTQESEFFP